MFSTRTIVVFSSFQLDAQPEQRLLNWLAAPHARFCHPREEHLLPLHVCLGAALQHSKNNGAAELVFNQPMMGRELQAFLWR